jgi:hypothetical protein
MTKIIVNSIEPRVGVTSVTFHDSITANGEKQWLDRFGIIKANSSQLLSNSTIASNTNGVTVGTVRVGNGCTITVRGDWRIV